MSTKELSSRYFIVACITLHHILPMLLYIANLKRICKLPPALVTKTMNTNASRCYTDIVHIKAYSHSKHVQDVQHYLPA